MATVKQIQHERYVAEVSYSAEDGCYYAQLVNAPGAEPVSGGRDLGGLTKSLCFTGR